MQPGLGSTTKPARRSLSRRKRLAFGLILLAATWLLIEGISLLALSMSYGGVTNVRRVLDETGQAGVLRSLAGGGGDVIHPYLGNVRRPGSSAAERGETISEFGFLDVASPLHHKAPDRVIVGILGGSLAEEFAAASLEALERDLRDSSDFSNKELVFVRLALSGYKQPQQLMVVNYLLALGAEFDVLINIDGFNEIVLPPLENVPYKVFTAFPRSWQNFATETGDLAVLRLVGRIAYLRLQTRDAARFFGRPPLRYSPTLNLAWRWYYSRQEQSLVSDINELNLLNLQGRNFAASGPSQNFADDAELLEHCARVWARSSLQIHQLCTAEGIRYFHFLQPNQYVSGSKPMNADERALAIVPGYPAEKYVAAGYPVLQREGARLAGRGVEFTDLTGIFADHPEPVYRDSCCHLNRRGNELLARKIAEVIRGRFAD